ncbi:MAG: protein-L-isoaspartate(D-aspartate) O-methyltransferase [Sediminibacterium sp.]|nr:protein-L-isoaspartate(D-aspartate) O-methyltransferase [Sediminibacterium sp.]
MFEYKDSHVHQGLRNQLVNQLREKGITDENVLQAMLAVPRHYFFDSAFEKIAYEDRAFPIAAGQTISQPYTVAYQSQLLQVSRNVKVLEIGTGSGYQSSVLAEMGARVYTIERQKTLFDQLQKSYPFKQKYPGIKFFYGDGFEGLPTFAPFDRVLITAAAPYTPPKLIEQMKPGAIMVIPRDEGENQRMIRITKQADGSLQEESFDLFSFVPMLTGKNKR